MTASHFYDDSGLISSYLLLSLTLPVTLYLSYSKLFEPKKTYCKCTSCLKHKKNKQNRHSIILLALLWTLNSYLLKNVLTLKMAKKGYNPYDVLGLEPESTKEQLKKAFRRKVAVADPLKYKGEEREKKHEEMKEIVKAYNLITQGIKLDTEGTTEVMAIPDWFVKKGTLILIVYALILGYFFPKYAYKKYRESTFINKYNVYYSTTDWFYKHLDAQNYKLDNSDIKSDHFIRSLIYIISNTKDLQISYKKPIKVNQIIEEKFGYPVKEGSPAYQILLDHLFRTEKADFSDSDFVQQKSLQIIQSYKEIANEKKCLPLLNKLFVLERMVVQAVFDEDYFLMQSNYTFEDIFTAKYLKKKLEYESCNNLQINDCKVYVEKTGITDTSVTLTDNVYFIPENTKLTVSCNMNFNSKMLVHAPFFKEDLVWTWFVYLIVNDELIKSAFVKESKRVKFTVQVSKDAKVRLVFKTGMMFGMDKEEVMQVKVVKQDSKE